MNAGEPALVDANILVYAASPASPQHQASRALLELEDSNLCVTPQVFAEFYSVVTNPRRVTAPFTPSEARAFIEECMPWMSVLPIPSGVVGRWAALAEQHGVTGADVFDLQLVATMLENSVRRIYTYNRVDFERFPEIHVLTP
jgi:toxin-antitoxin system PIN domain toxin